MRIIPKVADFPTDYLANLKANSFSFFIPTFGTFACIKCNVVFPILKLYITADEKWKY